MAMDHTGVALPMFGMGCFQSGSPNPEVDKDTMPQLIGVKLLLPQAAELVVNLPLKHLRQISLQV